MIKLYHVRGTRSFRVRWLMEELGLDYELVTMPLDEKVLRTPDMLARNPFGKVPAIEDGDVTLFESGAIVEYLLETYGEGRLQPVKGSPEWLRYLQWMHGSETLANFVGVVLFTTMRIPEEVRSDLISDPAKTRARFAFAAAEKTLGDKPYICGDEFTAADIMVTWALIFGGLFSIPTTDECPNLMTWWDRMKARPAYQRAMAD